MRRQDFVNNTGAMITMRTPALITAVALIAGTGGNAPAFADSANSQGPLLSAVREATQRYLDVNVAIADGYKPMFGCVTGPDVGAMGLHYVNMKIVIDTSTGVEPLDASHPQIVIYEPTANGGVRLIGADFLVLAQDWNAIHPGGAPQLMGQYFQFFDAPNRFGLPPFYTLHVWAWKDNPSGAFVNWHPRVSCAPFAGP